MSDYVDVGPELRLSRALKPVETLVRGYDAALRLRVSANPAMKRIGCGFVLERKTRYTAPIESSVTTETPREFEPDTKTEVDRDAQIAARDGYLIVDHVHVTLMMRPEAILERLRDGDLNRQTPGQRLQQLVDAESEAASARRKSRYDDFHHHYAESFDILDRLGDQHSHAERVRLSNAGVEPQPLTVVDRRRVRLDDPTSPTSAGERPAQESSDVHPPGTADGREDRQLHHQAAAG